VRLDRVPLRFARAPAAYLRELCGHDEDAVGGLNTLEAVGLIERLCVARDRDALEPCEALELCAHDRDRILAAIYTRAFGGHVLASARCDSCGSPFDFELAIPELQRLLAGPRATAPPYLPLGHDELAVAQLAPGEAEHELAQRCADRAGPAAATPEDLDAMLEELAPLLSLDLSASCPECSALQSIPFDIQTLLLGELLRAQRALWENVHTLASAYHWRLEEIHSLPRSRRRLLAEQAVEAGA
jgi:hypothetical protein